MKWYRLTKGWGQKTKLDQYIIQKVKGRSTWLNMRIFIHILGVLLGISRAEHSSLWTNSWQSLKRLSKQFHLENVCSKSDKASLRSQRHICPASCKLMQTRLLSIVNIREPFPKQCYKILHDRWTRVDIRGSLAGSFNRLNDTTTERRVRKLFDTASYFCADLNWIMSQEFVWMHRKQHAFRFLLKTNYCFGICRLF